MLADVADLRGPDAEALGGVVLREASPNSAIDLGEVRDALNARGVAWPRLVLRGSTCRLDSPVHAAPPAPTAAPGERSAPAAYAPPAGSVGESVAPALARLLGVGEADLRLEFDPDDASLLSQPAGGRTVAVHPLGRADRARCRVTIYEGDRIAAGGLVRVAVRVRRMAAVPQRPVPRGARLTQSDFSTQECWVGPTTVPEEPARVAGAVAKTSLDAGQPVLVGQVVSPAAVERGQIVAVHCVSGSVVVRLSARALADACEGETVEVEHLDSARHDVRRFSARVSGPGRVVVGATARPVPEEAVEAREPRAPAQE